MIFKNINVIDLFLCFLCSFTISCRTKISKNTYKILLWSISTISSSIKNLKISVLWWEMMCRMISLDWYLKIYFCILTNIQKGFTLLVAAAKWKWRCFSCHSRWYNGWYSYCRYLFDTSLRSVISGAFQQWKHWISCMPTSANSFFLRL